MAEVIGWRIVKDKHAKVAFSGEGARIFEGRWNSLGVRMVYCSENLALAALEIVAHTRAVRIRDKFRAFRIGFAHSLMETVDLKKLPKGWNAQPPGPVSKQIGDDWIKSGRSAVLALPSVLVPLERTFLLNPKHVDFVKIKIADAGEFVLDRRLR
ncbi:MAG TPA: RES family NAD+ phosphorylase [Chthoniobacterales bacterium]|jgi:RES domain-containing protein